MSTVLHTQDVHLFSPSLRHFDTRVCASKNRRFLGRDKYRSLTRPDHPAIIAFDLDGTLWDPEMYVLYGQPYASSGRNTVLTKGGDEITIQAERSEKVHMLGDTHAILKQLCEEEWSNTYVAYVSRTAHPKWAKKCLQLLQVTPTVSMDQLGALQEIYPGTKTKHFKKIHEETSIPYKDMLFFDNEVWNCDDVEELGVTCIHTPIGMTLQKWEQGLRQHAESTSLASSRTR